MKTLNILWQRLLDDSGNTCPRCDATQQAVEGAVDKLRHALAPLGIEPQLERRVIDPAQFAARPLESNRIWIAGQPLESWLQANAGASRCCASCGDADCRTVEVDGTTYEAIPEDLLIRAALVAASRMMDAGRQTPAASRP